MDDDVEVTQEDHAVLRAYFTARARLAFDGTTGPHADLLLQTLARHRIASVRAAAMSDAPSDDLVERVARAIHGVKMSGNNPDCLYHHHDYETWPVDDRREYADPFTGEPRVQLFHKAWRHYEAAALAAITAIGQDTRSQVEREIVAWLRSENGTCDCCARSEGECACGAWDDYKRVALVEIIDAIEQGQYRSEQ